MTLFNTLYAVFKTRRNLSYIWRKKEFFFVLFFLLLFDLRFKIFTGSCSDFGFVFVSPVFELFVFVSESRSSPFVASSVSFCITTQRFSSQLKVWPCSYFFFLPFIVFEKWVNTNVVVDTQR